jgi:predicted alpha/beta hydrolase family esterase
MRAMQPSKPPNHHGSHGVQAQVVIVPGWRSSGPAPYQRLPYRSILVASGNDPFCPVRLAGAYARAWGSEFVRLNDAGHINVDSGHGDWPLGWALLQSLGADTRLRADAGAPN